MKKQICLTLHPKLKNKTANDLLLAVIKFENSNSKIQEKTKLINKSFYFSEEEIKLLKNYAKKHNYSLSSYVNYVLKKD